VVVRKKVSFFYFDFGFFSFDFFIRFRFVLQFFC